MRPVYLFPVAIAVLWKQISINRRFHCFFFSRILVKYQSSMTIVRMTCYITSIFIKISIIKLTIFYLSAQNSIGILIVFKNFLQRNICSKIAFAHRITIINIIYSQIAFNCHATLCIRAKFMKISVKENTESTSYTKQIILFVLLNSIADRIEFRIGSAVRCSRIISHEQSNVVRFIIVIKTCQRISRLSQKNALIT